MNSSTITGVKAAFISLAAVILAGCSSNKPLLYPNDYMLAQSKAQIDDDLKYCMELADTYVQEPEKYQNLARGGITGGAVGAGAGALGGVIVGSNVGRSLGAGAAVGAVVAIANEMLSTPDHSHPYQAFVNHCLSNKGYEVTGWN